MLILKEDKFRGKERKWWPNALCEKTKNKT